MKKYVCLAMCAVMVVTCLMGCGKQDDIEPTVTQGTTDNLSVTELVTPQMQHITQEICDNLTIDADAVIPVKMQYGTYTLKMVDCTPGRLFSIFDPDGTGNYETTDRSSPGYPYYVYIKSDGRKIVVQDNIIKYSSYNINMGEQPMQEVSNLMYYYTQKYPNEQPHDLSFATVAEMEAYCRNVLTELGVVWDMELSQCVTLSGQEILDFQSEMLTDSDYTELGTPMTLTDAGDTCYIVFSFSYDGVPLLGSDEPNVSSYVSMFPTPSAYAALMINADGIQDCEVFYPCTLETISDSQKILSVEDGIAALKAKYDLEILFEAQVITNIWMEYIPVMQNENWVLIPYWCFVSKAEERIDSPAGDYENADRINAITGEDLAYGG